MIKHWMFGHPIFRQTHRQVLGLGQDWNSKFMWQNSWGPMSKWVDSIHSYQILWCFTNWFNRGWDWCPFLILFGDFEHHLQISVGYYIPNSRVMFNWDIYQPLFKSVFNLHNPSPHSSSAARPELTRFDPCTTWDGSNDHPKCLVRCIFWFWY